MTVLIYNNRAGYMERYYLDPSDPMPYVRNGTLTAGEFRGASGSDIIWTDRRAMEAWNTTRSAYGRPIDVGYAFRRIGEGGHSAQSQHYAGMSFDVGQRMTNAQRGQLRNLASNLGVWNYVEPAYLTPTWVHFDARLNPPACAAGYPLVRQGSKGAYVCALQDALGVVGSGVNIDGVFGPATRSAVVKFQRENGLAADGIVGCATWTALTAQANGRWRDAPAAAGFDEPAAAVMAPSAVDARFINREGHTFNVGAHADNGYSNISGMNRGGTPGRNTARVKCGRLRRGF